MPTKCMLQMPSPMTMAPPASQPRRVRPAAELTRPAKLSAAYDARIAMTTERVTRPRSWVLVIRCAPSSRRHVQHRAEAHLVAHHPLVGLLGILEPEALDPRPRAGERAEVEGVLRVARLPARPSGHRAPGADQLERSHLDRRRIGA